MTTARVVSVNVGVVRAIEWEGEIVTSAIWKSPVHGRVAVRGVNFAGDDQADRSVHGGRDKAVYAYAQEDYDFWREEHGVETVPGLFGENRTVEGIRMGAYLRIIDEGDVGLHDPIEVIERPSHGVTLQTMVGALHDPVKARALGGVDALPRFWRHVADRDH